MVIQRWCSYLKTGCRDLASRMSFVSGTREQAQRFLNQGADVNAKGQDNATLLMCATKRDHLKMVKMLLDNGADVNANTPDGDTALEIARKQGHKGIEDLPKARGQRN